MVTLSEKTKLSLRFDNVWAILVAIILAVSAYFVNNYNVIRRLDKIETGIAYLTKSTDEYFERNKEIQTRVGTIEVAIAKLETIINRLK
jgi:hypothetical protein